MLAAAQELGNAVYHVRYDDYVDQTDQLRALFAWLGLTFDEGRVRRVMARKYAQIPAK